MMNNMKKLMVVLLTVALLLMAMPVLAEEAAPEVQSSIVDTQKLDASYTLALNAINAEDYDTAKEYLSVCFAYCDPQTNPAMYADLLLKRACIDVIEEKNDMALLNLDAAIRVQPDLADAYLVRTQVYAAQGNVDAAIESLEKYIELTEDTSLYETVAQLNEAKGDIAAAQAAYDKYVEGAGGEVAEAGFQNGLYKMQAGRLEEAVADFEAYANDETYAAGAAYNTGICKMNLGDYAGAIEAFTTCEKKGGAFEGLYYNRGVCALDYETAVATFTALIDGEGETTEATEEAEATETEERVVNDGAYYYRAVCNAALGNLEAAVADYTVCIEHGYELAQTYYQRAQVYAALGDTEGQNADLQASLSAAE